MSVSQGASAHLSDTASPFFEAEDLKEDLSGVTDFMSPPGMPIKSDIETLQNPYFALSHHDLSVRELEIGLDESGEPLSLQIVPSVKGPAARAERELWLFVISKACFGLHTLGMEEVHTVRGTIGEFIRFAGRSTCGRSYRSVVEILTRLSGVRLVIEQTSSGATTRRRRSKTFGLVDDADIVEEVVNLSRNEDSRARKNKDRLSDQEEEAAKMPADWAQNEVSPLNRQCWFEVTLGRRVIGSLKANTNILTLSPKYFQLSRTFDRRVYEIARKFTGNQDRWECHISRFLERVGSSDKNIRKQIFRLRKIEEKDSLPDYRLQLIERPERGGDRPLYVVFAPKKDEGGKPTRPKEKKREAKKASACENSAGESPSGGALSLADRVDWYVASANGDLQSPGISSTGTRRVGDTSGGALPESESPRPFSIEPKSTADKVWFGYPESALRGELAGFARPSEKPFDTGHRLKSFWDSVDRGERLPSGARTQMPKKGGRRGLEPGSKAYEDYHALRLGMNLAKIYLDHRILAERLSNPAEIPRDILGLLIEAVYRLDPPPQKRHYPNQRQRLMAAVRSYAERGGADSKVLGQSGSKENEVIKS